MVPGATNVSNFCGWPADRQAPRTPITAETNSVLCPACAACVAAVNIQAPASCGGTAAPKVQLQHHVDHDGLYCSHSSAGKISRALARHTSRPQWHESPGPSAQRLQLHCCHLCHGSLRKVAARSHLVPQHAGQPCSAQCHQFQCNPQQLCKSRPLGLGAGSLQIHPFCWAITRCGQHQYCHQCLQEIRGVEKGC